MGAGGSKTCVGGTRFRELLIYRVASFRNEYFLHTDVRIFCPLCVLTVRGLH
jgi:hypothetical protein